MENSGEHYHFYMDESGQDLRNTPCVVVGGFLINVKNVAALEERVKADYLFCFGLPIETSKEIKGKDFLSKKMFKELKHPLVFTDEERRDAIAFLKSGQRKGSTFKGLVAEAQAKMLFINKVFEALEMFDCIVYCYYCANQVFEKIENRYSIDGNKHESNIKAIIEMQSSFISNFYKQLTHITAKKYTKTINFQIDKTGEIDERRKKTFLEIKNYQITHVEFDFIDSKNSLPLQIVDILLYLVNWSRQSFNSFGGYEGEAWADSGSYDMEIVNRAEILKLAQNSSFIKDNLSAIHYNS